MIPEFKQDYEKYRLIFLGVVGSCWCLKDVGNAIDAQDLVHDFFLLEWAKVRRNYDPEKGEFRPYICASFRRFAIREMLRSCQIQQQVFDIDEISDLSDGPSHIYPERQIDYELVRKLVDELPPNERRVLMVYMENRSLRETAICTSMGRYQAELALARAITLVALGVERPEKIAAPDWAITRMILKQGKDHHDIARTLKLKPADVLRAHRKNMYFLKRCVTKMFSTLTQPVIEKSFSESGGTS